MHEAGHMTFQQAIKSVLGNYTNFKDRSGRSEFWYWILFTIIVSVVVSIFEAIIGTNFLDILVSLAFLIPGLAVGARRMHDIGKSGWFLLIGLIPLAGWAIIIYFAAQPTEPAPNAWGSGPLAPSA